MTERPWGFFEILAESDDFKVKRIVVNPGHRLSLQRHRLRQEHWYIISGTARITLDKAEYNLEAGQSIDIAPCALHRIHNPGDTDLTIIEIQTGTYFGEDDIERISDDYDRAGQG